MSTDDQSQAVIPANREEDARQAMEGASSSRLFGYG